MRTIQDIIDNDMSITLAKKLEEEILNQNRELDIEIDEHQIFNHSLKWARTQDETFFSSAHNILNY